MPHLFIYLLASLFAITISTPSKQGTSTTVYHPLHDTVKIYNGQKVLQTANVFDTDSNLVSKIEYHNNGKVKSVTPYKNNQIDGIYRSYFTNGTPECYIEFKEGKKHGHYLCNTQQDLLYMYVYMQNDKRQVLCKYENTGNIVYYEVCKNNKCNETVAHNVPDSLSFEHVKRLLIAE